MALDPKILRDSFELVVQRTPDLTARFYDSLFRRKPELEPMFSSRPRATQEQMLGEALGAVLDHLEDAPWLKRQLAALGGRHAEYGVTRVMYDDVGAALLETLAKSAGTEWTPAVEDQWKQAYAAICQMMWAGEPIEGQARRADATASP